MTAPADLLVSWIARRATPEAMAWLAGKRADIARDPSTRTLALAFSRASRCMGKLELALVASDLIAAGTARPDWTPVGLSVDQAARIVLLIDAAQGPGPFTACLQGLVSTADVGELIAIYKGLPLYPDPPSLVSIATNGLRTAMRAVFEAVAHHNPFPVEQLPQTAWNHMVLKTLFIDSVLHPIAGLDRRWNPELAQTLCDYAHERWAAHRPVAAELWRGVGRFADDAAMADLTRVLITGNETEQIAAALALSESRHPAADRALALRPDLAASVAAGRITWNDVRDEPSAT